MNHGFGGERSIVRRVVFTYVNSLVNGAQSPNDHVGNQLHANA